MCFGSYIADDETYFSEQTIVEPATQPATEQPTTALALDDHALREFQIHRGYSVPTPGVPVQDREHEPVLA